MCTIARNSQQQNDYYMDGAREIKKLAELLSTVEIIDDIPIKCAICRKELMYIRKELKANDVGEIHFVLRGRLQYLIQAMIRLVEVP